MKKTVKVSDIIEHGNLILSSSSDELKEIRIGVIAMIEAVLHSADAYKGFNYLSSEFDENHDLKPDRDDTRCYYYISDKLRS